MRVQYTLPGMQLTPTGTSGGPAGAGAAAQAVGVKGATFKSRMKRLAAGRPLGWRRLLGLDRSSGAMTALNAPSRPSSYECRDSESQRVRFRSMLDRHGRLFAEKKPGTETPAALRDVERMLAMLIQMQDSEDVVVSRHLAETRG